MADWTRVEMVRGSPVQICILETDQTRLANRLDETPRVLA